MPQKDVERIRDMIERWNAGEIESVVDLMAEDSVIYPFPEWPGVSVYEGQSGWRDLIHEWIDSFDEVAWEVKRLEETPEHSVLALVVHSGTIRGTGMPLSQPLGLVVEDFRDDGRVGRARFFMTWGAALGAAGLPPES